ncbi:uncharacterized protein MONBRDRAFT_9748 [Monosiga brevicollis MX1]|uniref:Uncharacterized protein n=1 Tax=Monosiga brevicollis TaxID=81824 RepID=A9V442_MONBE|nr:uncharacterized protein MONBRDRAFT_9748 [Monosiga brevicollis MX1]EDQ87640.1 predicted protein [Monosiga brevicollis MX1]|eukprot:XP_001747560.1 hypothetical protein [Monosiga brevicollis MX1]
MADNDQSNVNQIATQVTDLLEQLPRDLLELVHFSTACQAVQGVRYGFRQLQLEGWRDETSTPTAWPALLEKLATAMRLVPQADLSKLNQYDREDLLKHLKQLPDLVQTWKRDCEANRLKLEGAAKHFQSGANSLLESLPNGSVLLISTGSSPYWLSKTCQLCSGTLQTIYLPFSGQSKFSSNKVDFYSQAQEARRNEYKKNFDERVMSPVIEKWRCELEKQVESSESMEAFLSGFDHVVLVDQLQSYGTVYYAAHIISELCKDTSLHLFTTTKNFDTNGIDIPFKVHGVELPIITALNQGGSSSFSDAVCPIESMVWKDGKAMFEERKEFSQPLHDRLGNMVKELLQQQNTV